MEYNKDVDYDDPDDSDSDEDLVQFKDTSQTTITTAESQLALVARQPSVARQPFVTTQPAAAASACTTRPHQLQFMLYIQMELCSETLKHWLEQRNQTLTRPTDVDAGVNKQLFRQILQGVQYIHSQSLLHRDLKPQNVFLTYDWERRLCAKLGDFGHSRLASWRRATQQTQATGGGDAEISGASYIRDNLTPDVGTLLYSAPEQLQNTEHSSKADCVSELTHVNPLLRPSAADLLRGSIFLLDDELIRQMRSELSRKDAELREKDATILELENQLNGISL